MHKIKSNQLVANPELEVANRLVYTMPVLQKDTRISGIPKFQLQEILINLYPNLTALLVDYGEQAEIVTKAGWILKLKEYRKFSGDSTGQKIIHLHGHAAR